MKKISTIVLAFVFLLGTTSVIAKGTNGNKDFSQPLKIKAEKVKLFGKKAISEGEREKGDLLESMIIKGKPTKPGGGDTSVGGVTGELGAPLPDGGQKYAVVIGLANYPGTSESTTDAILPDLCVQQVPDNFPNYVQEDGTFTLDDEIKNNCKDSDSQTMKDVLVYKYGFSSDNVHLFSDANAKFSAINNALNGPEGIMSKLTAKDELVFFFSGHGAMSYGDGVYDVDGDGEADDGGIVVYDENYNEALYKDLETDYVVGEGETAVTYDNYKTYYDSAGYDSSAYIWDGQLKEWFASAPTKRIFFAFDTCNAAEMDDLEEEVIPTVNGVGRVMAFSSGKNESSYTYYLGGQINSGNVHDSEGLFSHYFVKRAMWDGLADGSNPLRKTNPLKKDGSVAVEEAFSYAYPLVRAASSYRQTPVLEDAFTNDLLLGYPLPQ